MGWEWRVFFPISETDVDIWALLQSKPWSPWPGSRTDEYIVCSATAGVKLRGKKTLEVKLRSKRDASGAELWEKVLHTSCKWDGKDTRALGATIAAEMSKQRGWITHSGVLPEKVQAFEDTLALASSEIKFVSLSKCRVTHSISNVGLEQTEITSEGFPGQKWRSISLEGNLEDVKKLLQRRVTGSSKEATASDTQSGGGSAETTLGEYLTRVAGEPRGYPEFVQQLL